MPLSQHQLDAVPDVVGPLGAREGGGALSEKFSLKYCFNSVDVAFILQFFHLLKQKRLVCKMNFCTISKILLLISFENVVST